ncbi:MAG: phytanoyl-CoA dioxygenase family protein [Lentisphaerae bacterium]|nr:phytanoyl-CoA dioxygenase family protein [Lentisphaerota bacterium]
MPQDLSRQHSPIGTLYPVPDTHEAWERYRLSDAQVAFYRANGYLGGVRVLTDNQLEVLRAELERLMKPDHPGRDLFHEYHVNESGQPGRILFHALGAWRIEPSFHDLLWNPAVLVPASQLLGGAIRLWHDQLFCKPPHHGGVVPWHQDYSYWTRTKPPNHLTCWIALDDSTLANGCVHYIPGSHRWRLLPTPEGRVGAPMEAILSVLTEDERHRFKPVPVEVRKGECIFHHGLSLHGSYENNTDTPRRATVVNVFGDGTRSDTNEPLLPGIPVVPQGYPLTGPFFPLLYAPPRASLQRPTHPAQSS